MWSAGAHTLFYLGFGHPVTAHNYTSCDGQTYFELLQPFAVGPRQGSGIFWWGMASAVPRACTRSAAFPPVGSRCNALIRGLGGETPLKLTIFSHIKGSLNNDIAPFSALFMKSRITQFVQAGTELIYKLDELVTSSLPTYTVFNMDAMALQSRFNLYKP